MVVITDSSPIVKQWRDYHFRRESPTLFNAVNSKQLTHRFRDVNGLERKEKPGFSPGAVKYYAATSDDVRCWLRLNSRYIMDIGFTIVYFAKEPIGLYYKISHRFLCAGISKKWYSLMMLWNNTHQSEPTPGITMASEFFDFVHISQLFPGDDEDDFTTWYYDADCDTLAITDNATCNFFLIPATQDVSLWFQRHFYDVAKLGFKILVNRTIYTAIGYDYRDDGDEDSALFQPLMRLCLSTLKHDEIVI